MRTHTLRRISPICFAILAAALPGAAQAPLTNAALKGAYFVRYLGVNGYPNDFPVSFAGTLTFDGTGTASTPGNFTVSGSGVTFSGSSQAVPLTTTGTYTILSSGEVSMVNPFSQGNATLYGGVGANGVFIASSTESGYLDLIVGIPPSTSATKATLTGTYHVGGIEFAGGSVSNMRNLNFDVAADGNGNLGNLSLSGSSSSLNDATATQTISGATYTLVAAGSGTMTLPAPTGVTTANQLISGTKNLYVSPDGSFFIAGSPTGWDMQIGVKAIGSGGATIFNGLYYAATLENVTGANGGIDAWYGASNEVSASQLELYHERFNTDGYAGLAYDYTYDDSFAPDANGTSTVFGYFAVGGNGNFAFNTGGQGDYFLEVWVKTASFSGSGPFLLPTGVVNAASNAPFTAQISPGEVITLYGTGFTSIQQVQTAALPFPPTLGGVQVMINGTAAPIYVVSPTQINAVVPYSIAGDGSLASIQVIANGTPSNTVQSYTGLTSAGVFTVPAGGVGSGAILHADYSLVSSTSPAKANETVQLFLTGLGAVTPSVTAGTAAPATTTLSAPVEIWLYDANGAPSQATVTYQGLAPGLGGLYQVNFTVPSGMTLNSSGATSCAIEIDMLDQADSDNIQAVIPVSH